MEKTKTVHTPFNIRTIDNFDGHLRTKTATQWQELFTLTSDIKLVGELSRFIYRKRADGIFETPYHQLSPLAFRFTAKILELKLTPAFDWMSWTEGRHPLTNINYDMGDQDPITLCKLATIIFRFDRIAEGTVAKNFDDGTFIKIFEGLEKSLIRAEIYSSPRN